MCFLSKHSETFNRKKGKKKARVLEAYLNLVLISCINA